MGLPEDLDRLVHDPFLHGGRSIDLCDATILAVKPRMENSSTMANAQPEVDRAWELYEQLLPVLTERPEYHAAQAKTMIGGIIGRASMPDSANAVFEAARVDTGVDPDLEILGVEAAMRAVIGDVDGAIQALERFMVSSADHAPGRHWWWANLEGEPAFERLQAMH